MRSGNFVGFDVGGTKALGVVVSTAPGDDGAAPAYRILATARKSSAGDGAVLTGTLGDLCEELAAAAADGGTAADGPLRFDAVGLAVAGLAHRSGVVHFSPNLPDLLEFALAPALADELAGRLGYRPAVTLGNDATAGTWAEAHLGAGRGCDDFVFVALGTGIGTGFVVGGRLVVGTNGYAGESGHMVVDDSGPQHLTGVRGPWEYFASGKGLRRLGREAARAGNFAAGLELADGDAENVTSHHVHDTVAAGDEQALAILDEYCVGVALGISNLVMILDPARIVLGGGVADIGEPLRARIERELSATTVGASHRPPPEVVMAELGTEASAVGAALMAADDGSGPDG
ncbi:MAG TPA: glucokinase [Acidimicrobiaceae bacterium]|nr:glucokinase [Acidimicrobiaceae bacterium]